MSDPATLMHLDDTIVAIASAPGGAPRGVVRISGPQAVELARQLSVRELPRPLRTPQAITTAACLADRRELPVELFVWPRRRSYTREPTVELHSVGSAPLLNLVVGQVCRLGARLAEPGEFTLRAFLAGRIDLTQAEAVLGVIDAGSEAALDTALRQLAGGLAEPLRAAREELLVLLADLEAGLDFADEDIEFIRPADLAARLQEVDQSLQRLVGQLDARGVASRLPRVVLAGLPNAGKSSLFNALVERFGTAEHGTQAIVSHEPGATRDYLTAAVRLAGVDCELVDTAGAETVPGEATPAALAQMMTRLAREGASLVAWCRDAAQPSTPAAEPSSPTAGDLQVLTKADLVTGAAGADTGAIATSAQTGGGLDLLAEAIAQRLADRGDLALVPSTAERSRASLESALAAVESASQLAVQGLSEEVVAAELRVALQDLGQVAGAVYTDDVLDRVFSRFCIGK